ncbi:MAG: hypothetical protein GYB31_07635 [Bacteroidetes bacterium]|nr:hypothetical protein [Bacteroidota bacterium]
MKYFLTILCAGLFFMSCNNESSSESSTQDGATTPATTTTSPASTDGKVWHYTCPNNCANSGSDTQGSCPVCNSQLAHNQAWHNQGGNQPQLPQNDQASPVIQQTPPTAQPEPAQNAAGVWHYVCGNGCAGGAGAAGTCSSCGGALTHNSLYHQ